MPAMPAEPPAASLLGSSGEPAETLTTLVEVLGPTPAPTAREGRDAAERLAAAEDTLRAIAAGEVDGFVISDGASGRRVFTLSTADRPYRMFVENMRDGAATLSPTGIVLYSNRRLAELLSCARETVVGSPVASILAGPVGEEAVRTHQPSELGTSFEGTLVRSDGERVPVLVGSVLLQMDDVELTCLTFSDLSAQKAQDREIARLGQAQADRLAELQAAQAALVEQATHDDLTGLPNRRLLVDRTELSLAHARRSGRCTAVLFVDLDRFKHVNDTHGHAAGDAVLRAVAETLVTAVRPMDTVARIGGDEFAVLAPDLASHLEAVDIGTRLVRVLHEKGLGAANAVAASVGISVSVAGRSSAEQLLQEADKAMYKSKSLGGARAGVFDDALGAQIRRRVDAERTLHAALDQRRVIAHYQPIIDLPSGTVAGFEALARIALQDGAVLPPAAFISVAEESGLVVPLGAQILELACQEARGWAEGDAERCGAAVAVNLSARQFDSGDLASFVRRVLVQTGLDPTRLHLELTETAIIDLQPELLHQLSEIRDLGVQIGLDDFGTGYASLTHLRRLPLTFVKIDQTFIHGLGTDQDDERIVAAVINLANSLELRSIAEGVETEDQLHRLRLLGADQAQGYLFARPLPPGDVLAALHHPGW
jgi:diguanylate cyclase (GGDEF)-like protein/PAS domain S-box-containing protein